MTKRGWIGVDLDGTLARYDPEDFHVYRIGKPIIPMLQRVQRWIKDGYTVKIFTARATGGDPKVVAAIHRWCEKNELPSLEVTNVKDYQMLELWDDRAVQVVFNKGRPVVADSSRRGLE